MGNCSSTNNKSNSNTPANASTNSNSNSNTNNKANGSNTENNKARKSENKVNVKAQPNQTNSAENAVVNKAKPKPKKNEFIPISKMSIIGDIQQYYEFERHLGSGAFGLVREGIKKQPQNTPHNNPSPKDKELFAVKTVWKANYPDINFLRKEIEILRSLDHKNIVKCIEVFEDITCVHFVLELVTGGELFDLIINSPSGRLEEKAAIGIFMQMIEAVHYLHSEGFMHRDIKPENFLVSVEDGKHVIKLIDFGFATDFLPDQKLDEKVGSINYVAPEMVSESGLYDCKIDVWACGVVLFNLLAGKQPFADNDTEALVEKIKTAKVDFSSPAFLTVNSKVKQLIERILEKDPNNRLSAGEIKITPWISKYIGLDDLPTTVEEFDPKKRVKNIQTLLRTTYNMKPIFYEFCVNNLQQSLRKEIYSDFQEKNQDLFAHKLISYKELIDIIIQKAKLRSEGESYEIFNKFYEEHKEDCDLQKINSLDFIEKLLKSGELILKEKYWNLFKNIDISSKDYISLSSLTEFFSKKNMQLNEEKLKLHAKDLESIYFSEFLSYCEEVNLIKN